MKSRSTRTIAGLTAVLAAILVVVLWRSTSVEAPPIGPASTEASTVEMHTISRAPPLDEKPTVPTTAAPSTPDHGAPSESRASLAKPMWAKVIVHVTDPTQTVTDDRGRAPASLYPGFGGRNLAQARQGEYAFTVHPGRALFLLHQPGFKPVEHWLEIPGTEAVQREEVVLEPAWKLAVHLRSPDGRSVLRSITAAMDWQSYLPPRSPVAITASADPPGQATDVQHLLHDEWIPEVFSDDVTLDLLREPPIHVRVFLNGQLLATQRIDARVDEVTLTIGADAVRSLISRLVFRVVDANTAGPVDGVKASLVAEGVPRSESIADTEGQVRFGNAAPGDYTLEIEWEHRFMTSRAVRLPPGETLDLGTIELTGGVEISGSFSELPGDPDRTWFASIVADDPESGAAGHPRLVDVAWDQKFAVRDLVAGRYSLSAVVYEKRSDERVGRILGAAGPVSIDTRTGPVRNLAIELRPAATLGMRPTVADFEGYAFTIRSADGRMKERGRVGEYVGVHGWILPGSYLLTVTKLGELVERRPFEVSAGSITMRLDIP
jgi:hypothetical protein